ncbi:MAG: hypothetical protein ACPG6V_06975 [Flavobacteriales bacterium]
MKKIHLIVLLLISTYIFAQKKDYSHLLGSTVYVNHNSLSFENALYRCNAYNKIKSKFRILDINFSSDSRVEIFNRPLKITKVIPAELNNNWIFQLTNESDSFLFFYDIGFAYPFLDQPLNNVSQNDSMYFHKNFSMLHGDTTSLENGVYETRIDFINNKLSKRRIKVLEFINGKKTYSKGTPDRCYFIDKKTNKKIKKPFAISYKNTLYIRNGVIYNNKGKKDRNLVIASNRDYAKVINIGENYLYFETKVANEWAVAFRSQINPLLVPSAYNKTGVVWDKKKREFNLIYKIEDLINIAKLNGISEDKITGGKKEKAFVPQVRKIFDLIN